MYLSYHHRLLEFNVCFILLASCKNLRGGGMVRDCSRLSLTTLQNQKLNYWFYKNPNHNCIDYLEQDIIHGTNSVIGQLGGDRVRDCTRLSSTIQLNSKLKSSFFKSNRTFDFRKINYLLIMAYYLMYA